MAELVKSVAGFSAVAAELLFTALTGSDSFSPENADGRVTLVVRNTNAQSATVTLKAGNGSLSALGDIVVAVGGGKTVAVPLSRVDSARVKIIGGENSGRVLVAASVAEGGLLSNVAAAVLSVE